MSRTSRAYVKFWMTRCLALSADAAVLAAAYLLAFFLRFSFLEPSWGWRGVALSFAPVCFVHLLFLALFGCYRLAWRRTSLADLPRYVGALLTAALALALLRFLMPSAASAHLRPPYSVTLVMFFFAAFGLLAVRFLWRAWWIGRACEGLLLERDERHFDNTAATRFLAGRTVMVTGAGGSIGSEIVRQVAAAGARRILMVERGEWALYEIDRAMRGTRCAAECVPLLRDVADEARMEAVFAAEKPSVVLHAAAYKHVPMVELNPEEGWRNNAEATRTLAALALKHGVARFVLISTDKAVNPVSVMGQTKRAAEEAVLALNGGVTSFCAVRFGNVFGSSGSVVPLFREQIAAGGPVTVTHPDMRRYFMTLREAVSLVLQAASRTEGALYTLDMGESVRILDLAEGMIEQAGLRPYVDIPIVFTGPRPGEKLFEELDISEKSAYRTDMAKIYVTRSAAGGVA